MFFKNFLFIFLFLCSWQMQPSFSSETPILPTKNYDETLYKRLSSESLSHIYDNLNLISKNESKFYLTIEHLLYLSENEIITPDQSKRIWEFLINSFNKPIEKPVLKQENNKNSEIKSLVNKPSIELKNLNSLSFVGYFLLEVKAKMNFNQIMMLTIIGTLVFGFFIFLLSLAFYRTERYGLLVFFMIMVLYNLMTFARNLQVQLNSFFISGVLVNISFVLFNIIIHVCLIKFNFQKKLNKIKEILQCEIFFKGKLIQIIANLLFFYAVMFFFHSQLSQIPFYVSCYCFIYLLSQKFEMKFNKIFWPSWVFNFSLFSLLKIVYFYVIDKKNFILFDFESLYKFLFDQKPVEYENDPDFQYFGLIFSSLVLNALLPFYLYFQQNKIWKIYKTKEFSFKSLYKSIRSEMNQDKINLDLSIVYYYHVYAVVMIGLIFIGLKMKICFLVLVSCFTLQNYLCFVIKDGNLFWRILFYVGNFYISNAIFLMGKMEDKFANNLLNDFKDGYLIYYLSLLSKILLIYYSIDASATLYCVKEDINNSNSENENEESSEQEDEMSAYDFELFLRVLSSLFKFMLNYLFAVYLIVLAEEESSYLVSLLFLIFALVSFSKLLIYHSLTKDETNRTLISFCVYFGCIRLAFLPGKMHSPLYLGCLLSNLSVFASYISFKNLLFMILSFLMLFGLFIQALIMDTSFGMCLALINFSLLFSFLASKNASTIIYNFLLVTGLIFSVYVLNGFSMSFYFKLMEYLIEKLIPNAALIYLKNMKETGELAEQALAKQILQASIDYFLRYE